MTASTSGRFLWRNRINGCDGEGSVLETSNNFSRIRQSELLIRKAEGRRQKAEVLRRAGQSVMYAMGQQPHRPISAFCLLLSTFLCYPPPAHFQDASHER